MFEIASKPANCATKSEKEIVLQCYKQAIADLSGQPESEAKRLAMKRLTCGSVKRSKIEGVNSPTAVEGFIKSLGDSMMIVMRPGTKNPLLRFEVPASYRAYSPIVRLKDLELWKRGRVYASGISPCVIRNKGTHGVEWEHMWHAPHHAPVKVDSVTFILNETWTSLLEWFAGELPALWPATGDPGTQWIYLGVDKVDEHIHSTRRFRPYGSYKPTAASTAPTTTPTLAVA